ncbi:hypothetical protein TNCV_3667661 [Trichonephila clavipes]|nr:hypothetical protein TNCV_3667661 [Trichonephila clavipes]
MTATTGSDVVQSGRPIFDDFFQHLWPYIGNNTANVVFQMVKQDTESVEDDKSCGHPQISCTAENIEKGSAAVRKNRLQTIAESVRVFSAPFQWILTKALKMYGVCQQIVSRVLDEDQFANEVKSASQAELKDMAKNGFQKCFDDLYMPR